MTWPVTFVEIAGLPLVVCTILRVWYTFGLTWSLILQPLAVLGSLFWIWNGVSLQWAPDVDQGIIQAGQARWLWSIFMLWPVMERRGLLICFLALGFFAGNCSQLSHAIGTHFDISWLRFDRQVDRNSGWWQPVVGGTILCAAVGMHLPGIALEKGKLRLVAFAGVLLSTLAVVATGSRGAWIGALGTIVVGLPLVYFIGVRRGRFGVRAVSLKLAAGGLVALLLVGALAWTVLKGPVLRRYELAKNEIAAAVERGEYNSDTGARLWMAKTAVLAFREHPIRGIGAGGFRAYCNGQLSKEGIDPRTRSVHAHAHNTALQIAGTLGMTGLVLAVLAVFVALWNGLAVASRDLSRPYTLGPAFAIIGMLFAGMFDSIHINTQTCAVFGVLLALCPSYLPRMEPIRAPAASCPGADA